MLCNKTVFFIKDASLKKLCLITAKQTNVNAITSNMHTVDFFSRTLSQQCPIRNKYVVTISTFLHYYLFIISQTFLTIMNKFFRAL